ncbi:MAG: hypothetical protein NZ480_07635 [Bdellovibrionaceae bacterium]|nr:hypothetical protein [Pseudobdellovibrionaceae bacterium]MDW8189978.1 hypothetical protein [Pseudobdellovibrionaceae bacterium]
MLKGGYQEYVPSHIHHTVKCPPNKPMAQRLPLKRSLMAQSGQGVVEYVLLLVVVLAMSSLVREYLLRSRFVQNFTLQPWERLNGMIQCGVWQPCGFTQQIPQLHPESVERVLSLKPQ